MNRVRFGGIVVVILVAIALVFTVTGGAFDGNSEPATTPTSEEGQSGDPAELADLSLYPTVYDRNTSFQTSTRISVTVYGYENLRYEDVLLCLYSQNGSVLGKESIGTIYSPDSGVYDEEMTVNISVGQRPFYFVVDHPELRNDSRLTTELRVWLPEHEAYDFRLSGLDKVQDEFEFPRTHEVGTCG